MDKRQLDELVEEAFEDAVRSGYTVEIPDPDASWNKVAQKIEQRTRRRRLMKRVRAVGATAAALILGALIFGQPQQTEAFLPVTKIWADVKEGVIYLVQGDRNRVEGKGAPKGMLTVPPSDGVAPVVGTEDLGNLPIESTLIFSSIEEAQQGVDVRLPEVTYIPQGYSLDEVALHLKGSEFKLVYYYFREQDTGKLLFLRLLPTGHNYDHNTAGRFDENLDGDPILINNNKALITKDGDYQVLLWSTPDYNFTLRGDLEKTDIIKFAEYVK